MVQLAQTFTEEAKANNNLLPKTASFNNEHSWDSDNSIAVVVNSIDKKYLGTRSCLITHVTTELNTFTYGDGSLSTVIKETGQHILSIGLAKDDYSNADIIFKIQVFINSIALSTNLYFVDVYDSSGFINGHFNVYFQTLQLNENDVVDFIFYSQSDTVGAKLYLDRFKLEFNDKYLESPSIYSETPDTILEKEVSINLPSITSGSQYTISEGMFGSKVGDFVNMVIPSNLAETGLIFMQPYAIENFVKCVVFNPTGLSIDVVAGIFKFKIVQ